MGSDSVTRCGACCTKIRDLSVTVNRNRIVENINLHMHCGQLTTLIGANGAGKTTLLRAILGEIPHSGDVQFLCVPEERSHLRPRIGYVPQKISVDHFSPMTVNDLFGSVLSRRPVWAGVSGSVSRTTRISLELTGADELADRKIGVLSTGQLQRVLLALALTPVPNILLLDEPLAGVDASGMERFYALLSRFRHDYDLAILLVSHDLPAAARVSDRMVFLNRSIVCEGHPAAVLSHPDVSRTFGHDYSSEAVPHDRSEPERVSSAAHTGKE